MSEEPVAPQEPVSPPAPVPEAAPGSIETPPPVAPQLGEPSAPTPDPVVIPDPVTPPDTQAPTVQPALPVSVFGEHGAAGVPATIPALKKGVYVDTDGVKHEVEIVASRKDGSVDILLPATVGGYRRDGVRRRESDEQTTNFIE